MNMYENKNEFTLENDKKYEIRFYFDEISFRKINEDNTLSDKLFECNIKDCEDLLKSCIGIVYQISLMTISSDSIMNIILDFLKNNEQCVNLMLGDMVVLNKHTLDISYNGFTIILYSDLYTILDKITNIGTIKKITSDNPLKIDDVRIEKLKGKSIEIIKSCE